MLSPRGGFSFVVRREDRSMRQKGYRGIDSGRWGLAKGGGEGMQEGGFNGNRWGFFLGNGEGYLVEKL